MPSQPTMTKRQALLTLIGAIPVMAYGKQAQKDISFTIDTKGSATAALIQLNLQTDKASGEAMFLVVTVNGREEVRVSMTEAIQILKGAA